MIYGSEIANDFKLVSQELTKPNPDLHLIKLYSRELVGLPKQFVDQKLKGNVEKTEGIVGKDTCETSPILYMQEVDTEKGKINISATKSINADLYEESCNLGDRCEIKFARLPNPTTEKQILDLIIHQMKEHPECIGTAHFTLQHIVLGKSPSREFDKFKGCTIKFIDTQETAYINHKCIYIPCPPKCWVGEELRLVLDLVEVETPQQALAKYKANQPLSISCSSKGHILTDYAANLIIRNQLQAKGYTPKTVGKVFGKLFSSKSVGAKIAQGEKLLHPRLSIRLQLACRSALSTLKKTFSLPRIIRGNKISP